MEVINRQSPAEGDKGVLYYFLGGAARVGFGYIQGSERRAVLINGRLIEMAARQVCSMGHTVGSGCRYGAQGLLGRGGWQQRMENTCRRAVDPLCVHSKKVLMGIFLEFVKFVDIFRQPPRESGERGECVSRCVSRCGCVLVRTWTGTGLEQAQVCLFTVLIYG